MYVAFGGMEQPVVATMPAGACCAHRAAAPREPLREACGHTTAFGRMRNEALQVSHLRLWPCAGLCYVGVASPIDTGQEVQMCADVGLAGAFKGHHAQHCSVQLRRAISAVESLVQSDASKSLQQCVALQGRGVATSGGKLVFYLMTILDEMDEHLEQRQRLRMPVL